MWIKLLVSAWWCIACIIINTDPELYTVIWFASLEQPCVGFSVKRQDPDRECLQKGFVQTVHRCLLFQGGAQTWVARLPRTRFTGWGRWCHRSAPEELRKQELFSAPSWSFLWEEFRRLDMHSLSIRSFTYFSTSLSFNLAVFMFISELQEQFSVSWHKSHKPVTEQLTKSGGDNLYLYKMAKLLESTTFTAQILNSYYKICKDIKDTLFVKDAVCLHVCLSQTSLAYVYYACAF